MQTESARRDVRAASWTDPGEENSAPPEAPPDWIGRRSVALVGMMGSGKSSLGRRLAKRWGLPFSDSDEEIVKCASMSIATLFEQYGEAAFRDGEAGVIARLASGPQCVLALGGGAFEVAETRGLLLDQTVVAWLDSPAGALHARLKRSKIRRPLLEVEDPLARLESLLALRTPNYRQAHVHVALGFAGASKARRLLISTLAHPPDSWQPVPPEQR